MPNRRKRPDIRKTEIVGVRVNKGEKETIQTLAKIMEVSVSDLLKSAFDGLLDGKNENSRDAWKFLFRAAGEIDAILDAIAFMKSIV